MEIRIGNDIRFDITFEKLGIKNSSEIDRIECLLINTKVAKPTNYKKIINGNEHYIDNDELVIEDVLSCDGMQHYVERDELIIEKDLLDSDTEHYVKGNTLVIEDSNSMFKHQKDYSKQFLNHNEYTICEYCSPTYNVYPYNAMSSYFFNAPLRCGIHNNTHKSEQYSKEYIRANVYISEEDSTVYMYFPSNKQKCGTYELILKTVTRNKELKESVPCTQTFDYGKIFKLVEDEFGECGNVVINLPKYNNFSSNIKITNGLSEEENIENYSYFYGIDSIQNVLGNDVTIQQLKNKSTEKNKNVTKAFSFSGKSEIFYVLYKDVTNVNVVISLGGIVVDPTWYIDNNKFDGYIIKYFHVNGNYVANSVIYQTGQL